MHLAAAQYHNSLANGKLGMLRVAPTSKGSTVGRYIPYCNNNPFLGDMLGFGGVIKVILLGMRNLVTVGG